MIETPTVLILGAGASNPYGYPLGDSLKQDIITLVRNKASEDSEWFENLNYSLDTYLKFATKLERSRQPSIDSFISNQTEDFAEIGKIAIAEIISSCESKELIENPQLEEHENIDGEDDWYSYLIEHLFRGNLEDVHKNIGIISFNYDRSLEAILMESLISSYKELETYKDGFPILDKIPIVHMYGRLDYFPWEKTNGRPYGQKCSFNKLKEISENIRLIHESEFVESVNRANSLLSKSDRVYFLGMDLNRNRSNIERLNLSLLEDQKILATGYGLEEGERNSIQEYFTSIQKRDGISVPILNTKFTISNSKTLMSIKKHYPL